MKDNLDPTIPLPPRRSNRPVRFVHHVEFWLVRALFAAFRIVGVDAASFISGKSLRVIGPLIRPVSRRAEANLRLIFPTWSDHEIRRTTRAMWENLGRTAAEYAHLDKFSTEGAEPRIRCVGVEAARPAFEAAGRAVFVSGHFANWEIPGIAARQLGLQFGVIYRPLNNPLIDEMIIRMRARVATRRQIPKGPPGARAMIDLLRDGYSVAILADQKMNAGGLDVPFMGHDAMTAPAAARIAVRFGLPVIPIATRRDRGARFEIALHEPIDFTPSGDFQEDIRSLTILINEALERTIRDRPGEWLWLHRRWARKGAPPSTASETGTG